jgi:acyl dehydratase
MAEVTDVRISKSKPELGFVTHVATLRNARDEDVYVLKSTSIVKSRFGKPS